MNHKVPSTRLVLFVAPLLCLFAMNAWGIDWQAVPSRKVTLFYPGQASWEWLLTDHKGAAQIKAGQFCAQCHEGSQDRMGQLLVSGKLLEPAPIAGKKGAVDAEVKTAYDRGNLYVRMEWTTVAASSPFEAMAAIMLDDGQVPEMTRGGCWGACHDDMSGMASAETGKSVSKYLVKSRTKMTRKGGGDNIKSAAELKTLFDAGFFTEIWQAQLNPGQAARVVDGYVLEARRDHNAAQISAKAGFNNGRWTVQFSRKLKLSGTGYKTIESGKTYTMGIAIHDGHVQGRQHYVSFGYTLRLDEGAADFIARKQ